MARSTKAADDLDDLVDELEDLELDDEGDPDEAPKKTRTRKTTSKKSTTKKVVEGISTREVADAAGIEPRQLRMFLRASGYQPKEDREGRYHWKSLNDPEVKEILKKIKAGEVDKLNKEKIASLKGKKKAKAS